MPNIFHFCFHHVLLTALMISFFKTFKLRYEILLVISPSLSIERYEIRNKFEILIGWKEGCRGAFMESREFASSVNY